MGRCIRASDAGSVCLLLGLLSQTAYAYTPTVAQSGVPVRWKNQPQLNFAGNPQNQIGISDQDFQNAVVRSLQRWKSASSGTVRFDYWQGRDSGMYEPNSEYNGLSSIYFASNQKSGTASISPNVLGLTQVWYDTNTGEILETDIVLNDKDFYFTTDSRDTSGYGTGRTSFADGKNHVFIENVITHELGHAIGLSHSGGLQSTMLFMESPEQAHLGCDEAVAVNGLYPGADAASRGALSGTIVNPSGGPLFGAHVLAISRKRGTVLASGMTDKNGHYLISGLEPGAYFIEVEPFFAGSQTLPGYFSSVKLDVCGSGQAFSRTFLTDESGYGLKTIVVGAGGARASVPTISVKCVSSGGAAVTAIAGSPRLSTAPVVFDAESRATGFGAVDRFSGSNTTYYRLNSVEGRIEVHAMSYSLYSPVKPTIELLDADGEPVGAEIIDQVYTGDSGFINFDSALFGRGLPRGDYYVKVTASGMDSSLYPAGPISLDSVPFLVLTGSMNEPEPALSASLAQNPRCKMSESFAAYQSPGGSPPRSDSAKKDDSGGFGFCGTVKSRDGRGGSSGNGSGPGAAAILGWFLPFFVMAAIARLMKGDVQRFLRRRSAAVTLFS